MSHDVRKLTKRESRNLRQMAREYAQKRIALLVALGILVVMVVSLLTKAPIGEVIGLTAIGCVVFYLIVLMPSIAHVVDWRETDGWYQDILWGGKQPD